ncbi:MAG: Hsp20/alpha crystallin family protein, partial [Mesorhizobium sp.]
MSVRDLIPWGRDNGNQATLFRAGDRDPLLALHREVNRLFDDVFRGFGSTLPAFSGASAFGGGWPSVEI